MKNTHKTRIKRGFLFALLLAITISPLFVKGESYSKQNFILNDESVEYLNITNKNFYNGTIHLAVTVGANVTGTLNGVSKTVALDEVIIFPIVNVTTIVFTLSTEGSSQGYFEVRLTLLNSGANRSVYITLAVLGGIVFLFAAVSFFIRSKKYQTKPEEEDEELTDPETLKKRREASGAETKFWGLKDKK